MKRRQQPATQPNIKSSNHPPPVAVKLLAQNAKTTHHRAHQTKHTEWTHHRRTTNEALGCKTKSDFHRSNVYNLHCKTKYTSFICLFLSRTTQPARFNMLFLFWAHVFFLARLLYLDRDTIERPDASPDDVLWALLSETGCYLPPLFRRARPAYTEPPAVVDGVQHGTHQGERCRSAAPNNSPNPVNAPASKPPQTSKESHAGVDIPVAGRTSTTTC